MADKKRKWIKAAVSEGKGKLHEHLGVPKGDKIPTGKLEKAIHSKNTTIRREANLAMTLKGFSHSNKSALKSKMYGKAKAKD